MNTIQHIKNKLIFWKNLVRKVILRKYNLHVELFSGILRILIRWKLVWLSLMIDEGLIMILYVFLLPYFLCET